MQLESEEREILELAMRSEAEVELLDLDHGLRVRVAGKVLGESDRLMRVRYVAALKSLCGKGYVEHEGGVVYRLTLQGIKATEELAKEKSGIGSGSSVPSEGMRAAGVFICHSHKDDEFALRLATDLQREGINVWYDGWDLDIGHDLTLKIQEGIQSHQYMAVVLSPDAVASTWVRKEWTSALHSELETRQVRVLPLLYKNCELPAFLLDKKYADFRDPNRYDEARADLVRVVRGISKRPPKDELEPTAAPPDGPPNTDLTLAALLRGLTAGDEAVLAYLVKNAEDSIETGAAGADLAKALEMTPDEVNDSVEILEGAGYVATRDWSGTAPYHFGQALPTADAFRAARKYLSYDPDDDVRAVAAAIVSIRRGRGRVLGEQTALSAARISRAVSFLEQQGLVKVLRGIGTAPYDFAQVEATAQLRRFVSQFGGATESED